MIAARRITSLTIASLCALSGVLALWATPGWGADEHKYLSQFSEVPAVGPHGESVPVSGPLNLGFRNAMAVDAGEVYVADGGRIDGFDAATGAFVSQFPQVSSSLELLHQGLAIGHAGGAARVYIGGDEETEAGPKGVVVVFDAATGTLQRVWTGVGTPSKERFACFECTRASDVAVDDSGVGWAAGDVYVTDPEHGVVDVFEPETGNGEKLVTQLKGISPGEPFTEPYGVQVEEGSGDVLLADQGSSASNVYIFRPAAVAGQYEFAGKLALPTGVSVLEVTSLSASDGEGDVYMATSQVTENATSVPDQIFEFNAAGEFEGRIGPADVPGGSFGSGLEHPEYAAPYSVAADPVTHKVYLASVDENFERPNPVFVFGPNIVLPDVATAPASSVEPTSATLNGTVDIDKATAASCQFDWGTSRSLGEAAACPEKVEAAGKVPVSVALTGLRPDTTYYYRLQATNANGTNSESQVQDFTTPGPGGLPDEWASQVSSTSATLDAQLSPHGAPTSYYFEYGRSSEYEAQTPAAPGAPLGAGTEAVEVARHVEGLAPGVLYHYRVLAVSELTVKGVLAAVTFPGPDRTFTTQDAGGEAKLLDGREWELVSPAEKQGGLIDDGLTQRIGTEASLSGDQMAYWSTQPLADARGNTTIEPLISTRGSAGWSTQSIALPHTTSTSAIGGPEYQLFSEDLSLGLLQPGETLGEVFVSQGPDGSPQDTEITPYLRHNDTCATAPQGCLQPLVTSAAGYSDEPSGTTEFGKKAVLADATPDLAHVILSESRLAGQGSFSLYEWSSGRPAAEQLQPVSVLPENEGGALTFGQVGFGGISVRHAMTNDGSRVIWQHRTSEYVSHLYLRDLVKGETLRLDAVQGGSGAGRELAHFQIASGDASKVFFTSTQRLTADAGAKSAEADLYECEIAEVAGKLTCALSDLTPISAGSPARVQGGVLGASEDGSYVYYVAAGVLSSAENGRHERAVDGLDNLYMSHYDSGSAKWESPRLLAVLSGEDASDWNPETEKQAARVTPDGRYLTFMSDRSLTGYDNRDVDSGQPNEEVFLFDAGEERLVCASCNPTGARPEGVEYGFQEESAGTKSIVNRMDNEDAWPSTQWVAAQIPAWAGSPFQQPRYLSPQARLFFDSTDALVPRDINHNEDVYEYEPAGVGSCTTTSRAFHESSGGCLGLVSSGTSGQESGFVNASQDGSDVFFLTAEKLVAQDVDTAIDVYDAHACTSQSPCFSTPATSPECTTTDACRASSPSQPAIFGAPSSATFSGAGNVTPAGPGSSAQPRSLTRAQKLAHALRACHRQRARRRLACARRARKQYGPTRPRKANASRKGKG